MSNQQIIIDAINAKQNIAFVYQQHLRECSPHAIGYKGDEVNVLVYQFGGMTSKGPVAGDSKSNWRCLHLSEIGPVTVIGGEWHSFENHSRPATCIDDIIAEVLY